MRFAALRCMFTSAVPSRLAATQETLAVMKGIDDPMSGTQPEKWVQKKGGGGGCLVM